MPTTIALSICANGDDAFVSWAPSAFIPGCRGFKLERGRMRGSKEVVELVENRVGFAADKPKAGEHRPSSEWPFQRFNWTDHAVDVGDRARYRVTAVLRSAAGGLVDGVASPWSPWIDLATDVGGGFSCYFNRGIVLSQFVARYMKKNGLTPKAFKDELKQGTGTFRSFLMGDLGARVVQLLDDARRDGTDLHAALYELDDETLQQAMIQVGGGLHLILSNGSGKSQDGNAASRQELNDAGIPTVDRLLKSKGLGHNKFAVATVGGKRAVWTGSTNWSTTGLCTQMNNGLLIVDEDVADRYAQQWELLRKASPPELDPAGFPKDLVASNDAPTDLKVGAVDVRVRFTRTSDGSDMEELRDLIQKAKRGVLFLMFTPGPSGLHMDAAARAKEPGMYVRGVVSSLGNTREDNDKNFVDISLVGATKKPVVDRYAVSQPQGIERAFASWITEVNRRTFLSQIGHAIVHSKVLVIDPFSDAPVLATGSHNFSKAASEKNDENLVIVRGHPKLAQAYAANIMSVYQHYRFRSYVRQTLAGGGKPWSYLDDDDKWFQEELTSRSDEIAFWTAST